jgi:3'(2'), 5'-bisphosphate nucleotidase
MSQVEATYLMHALYNTSNGFFDHRAAANDAKSPFAVVRAFPEENPLAESLLEDLALRYKTNQIWERYKLNFLEYIALPMPMGHQGVVVVASRSHQTEETTAFIENLRKQGQPVTLISSGSSLKICLVAEGTADVYPRFAPTMEWDTAAGHAIARAAGCEVYHIDGKTPLKYNKEDLHNPWFIVKPL